MNGTDLELLDDALTRVFTARHSPRWRRRLFRGLTQLTSLSDLRVLRAVERRVAKGEEASISDVAEVMGVEHSTASRAVTSAVTAGLLDKTQSSVDQRRCVLVLTPLGAQALAETTERRRTLVAEDVTDWSDDDIKTLTTLMDRLANDLEARS